MRELNEQLDAKLRRFDEIYTAIDAGEDADGDDPYDALNEAPLEIKRALVVVLATGGPHVEAVVELDTAGTISSAHLYGYWGGQRASKKIPEDSGLLRALESYTELANV